MFCRWYLNISLVYHWRKTDRLNKYLFNITILFYFIISHYTAIRDRYISLYLFEFVFSWRYRYNYYYLIYMRQNNNLTIYEYTISWKYLFILFLQDVISSCFDIFFWKMCTCLPMFYLWVFSTRGSHYNSITCSILIRAHLEIGHCSRSSLVGGCQNKKKINNKTKN